LFQLIVNGVLTGMQIVRYNPNTIIGWRFGFAPVEDLAFGFSLITFTLSWWVWLTCRPSARRDLWRQQGEPGRQRRHRGT
jgi:hypothetical protein